MYDAQCLSNVLACPILSFTMLKHAGVPKKEKEKVFGLMIGLLGLMPADPWEG